MEIPDVLARVQKVRRAMQEQSWEAMRGCDFARYARQREAAEKHGA